MFYLKSLHEVGLDGIFHQYGQRPAETDVICRYRLSLLVASYDDLSQTCAHVTKVCSQSEDGHDLTGYCDVELSLTSEAFFGGWLANGDLAEVAVICINDCQLEDTILKGVILIFKESSLNLYLCIIGY